MWEIVPAIMGFSLFYLTANIRKVWQSRPQNIISLLIIMCQLFHLPGFLVLSKLPSFIDYLSLFIDLSLWRILMPFLFLCSINLVLGECSSKSITVYFHNWWKLCSIWCSTKYSSCSGRMFELIPLHISLRVLRYIDWGRASGSTSTECPWVWFKENFWQSQNNHHYDAKSRNITLDQLKDSRVHKISLPIRNTTCQAEDPCQMYRAETRNWWAVSLALRAHCI